MREGVVSKVRSVYFLKVNSLAVMSLLSLIFCSLAIHEESNAIGSIIFFIAFFFYYVSVDVVIILARKKASEEGVNDNIVSWISYMVFQISFSQFIDGEWLLPLAILVVFIGTLFVMLYNLYVEVNNAKAAD